MPVFRLHPVACAFPDPELAEPDGLLAVDGDLSVQRLLAAYSRGIFPWYGPDLPILWWSLDPRCVLFTRELHVPRSLRRALNSDRFQVTLDTAFARVVRGCASAPRPQGAGTWIVPEMAEAYIELHEAGYCHSIEVWQEGEGSEPLLAGGMYGVCLGGAFFGESMFFRVPEASKVALVRLVEILDSWSVTLLDCQQTTDHMLRFGAREIPRREFNALLEQALLQPTRVGPWRYE